MNQLLKNVKHHLLNTGWQRYCPVCERYARRFWKFGVIERKDARCPWCNALERDRFAWLFLKQRGVKGKLLHLAPEPAIEKRLRLLLGKEYVTADLLRPADVQMDITDIQYPDQSFDAIYCSHVLEHVLDDGKAMRELHRVLSKDGWALVMVPITVNKTFEDSSVVTPEDRLVAFGQEDHVRRYGPDFKDRLEQAGFEVEVIHPTDLLSDKEIKKMAITRDVGGVYFCRKF
jgi:SAM-dependent methyltransferase